MTQYKFHIADADEDGLYIGTQFPGYNIKVDCGCASDAVAQAIVGAAEREAALREALEAFLAFHHSSDNDDMQCHEIQQLYDRAVELTETAIRGAVNALKTKGKQ